MAHSRFGSADFKYHKIEFTQAPFQSYFSLPGILSKEKFAIDKEIADLLRKGAIEFCIHTSG